jgi:Amt family ammonium transporter
MKKSLKLSAILLFLGILAVMLALALSPAGGSDPTGAAYIAASGNETLTDVATTANKGYYGANYTWVMITGFMVFFFQCGFAMVETGFVVVKMLRTQ